MNMFDLIYPSEPAPLYPRPTSDRPGKQPIPRGEMLPLIESSGLVYGQAPRVWCHSEAGAKAMHPVVHLHLIDRFGKLYLQKRSLNKHLLPGYWDTAVGGHISYGEQVMEALYREAGEELGLVTFNPVFLDAYPFFTGRDSEMVVTFAAVGHPDLHPDNAEVSEGKWWSFEELDAAIGKKIITPNFEWEFSRIRERLLALL